MKKKKTKRVVVKRESRCGRHLFCYPPAYYMTVLTMIAEKHDMEVNAVIRKAVLSYVRGKRTDNGFNYKAHIEPFKQKKIGVFFSLAEVTEYGVFKEKLDRRFGGVRCRDNDLFCKIIWDKVPQVRTLFFDTVHIDKGDTDGQRKKRKVIIR